MLIIVVLIMVSVVEAIVFLIPFIWAVKSGQYDDTYSPSVRMLIDDKPTKNVDKSNLKQKKS